MIFKVKITMHSLKLFKFLESVFDLPSLPPSLLGSNFCLSCSGSMLSWGLLAVHSLVLQREWGSLYRFSCYGNASAFKVFNGAVRVLAGK